MRTYTGPEAAKAAGITYRQLDYWCTMGLVCPSGAPADGPGSRRGYTQTDVDCLRAIGRLHQTLGSRVPDALQHLVVDAVRSGDGDEVRVAGIVIRPGDLVAA